MTLKKPLFSIITPSYNQGVFISTTVESVLHQDVKDVEHIIMDGGSNDSTLDVLKSFGKRIVVESKPDNGQAHAINKGMKIANGQILAYLNSDDYYLPGALQTVEAIFEENPNVQWVVGDAQIVDANGNEIQSFVRAYKSLLRKIYFPNLLGILNPIPQPSVFFRASAVKKIGLFNESLSYTMDYEYWWRLQNQFGSPYFVNTALSAFRIHQNSKGGSSYRKQFDEEQLVASRFTSSSLLLHLHALHNRCILAAYSILK
ncbi:glycosyltransferase [Candidatus Woesebacteria bacterium]|nr:glycosyltransferase [Candidatus Woesebacteria bacterium]